MAEAANGIVQNMDGIITEINWVTKMSKGGNPYSMLVVVLDNGVEMEMFVDRAYGQIITMLLKGEKKTA